MLHSATETGFSRGLESSTSEIAPGQHSARASSAGEFRHDALFYEDDHEFVDHVAQFVRAGVTAHEPVLVVVQAPKIARLRGALDDVVEHVQFADMAEVGANPARIIPAWTAFVGRYEPGTRVRGVGEPLYVERSAPERAECHVHEALLNVALDSAAMTLLCPYDATRLPTEDLHGATHNHIGVHTHGTCTMNDSFVMPHAPLAGTLPPPSRVMDVLDFDTTRLRAVRHLVDMRAEAFGIDDRRREDCVLAVSEIATNSIMYGGGGGTLRTWIDGDRLLCEVTDRGRVTDPLAGRRQPAPGQNGGYGLWLANQFANLVQVRTNHDGTVVRAHFTRAR
jgi:anti-sigma regulatory factor (Ser/Thr protein kinase)